VLASQGFQPDDHVVNLQDIPRPQEKLIQLLNAKQLVSGGKVRELENGFPYAFLVPKATVKPEENILSFMKSDEFEPRETVVFSNQPKQGLISTDRSRPFAGSCRVLSYATEEIRFGFSCNQPAYLVMSEIWYPGWVAFVDGEEREVLCGNYLFRVVPVEKGNHTVAMRFVSRPFRIGALLSAATLGLGVFFWWRGWRRKPFKGLQEKPSAA
jgi:hypothetical protein